MHNVPPGSEIPWHRVINAQGRISLPKAGGHFERQRKLLESEGVVLVAGKTDLKKFGWKHMAIRTARTPRKRNRHAAKTKRNEG
jgi:alkylated DNA nucleotide flippase Atl1